MAGARCDHCGVEEYMPYVCKFCKGRFCAAHRLPENHACAGLGAHRERMRAEGRVFAPSSEPMQPRVSRAARASGMMDAFWSKVDGRMTYVLLGVIVATFLAENVVLAVAGEGPFLSAFVIRTQDGSPFFWLTQPWTILTSVFAHAPAQLNHILFNSLALLFFGHTVERLIGTRRYTWLFLGAGALAGVVQVLLMYVVNAGAGSGALGASGALQGVMGTLVVLAPTLTVLVFFIVPAPLWALVVLYVLLDVVGFISPQSGIANVAHLTGLAVGLGFGYYLRKKGLRVHVRPQPAIRREF